MLPSLWFPLSVSTAFSESLFDLFGKKCFTRPVNEYAVAFLMRLTATLFFVFFLPFINIPQLDKEFYTTLCISGSINILATVLYVKAIRQSDLSLVAPLLTFTPLFLIVTSPLILGEYPSRLGMAGIFLIVGGSYLLNAHKHKEGFLAPFRYLLGERGSRYMFIVAFIWSISANYDKIGVRHSSPILWSFALEASIALGLLIALPFTRRPDHAPVQTVLPQAALSGLCGGIALAIQMAAIQLTYVPYVISIKRTSTLFSVLWGHFIFKEKGLKERLLGTSIMLLGVALIALS